MGVHYVNGAYLNDKMIDIAKPEAVMYEPQADGSMQLIAVEYIAFEGPARVVQLKHCAQSLWAGRVL